MVDLFAENIVGLFWFWVNISLFFFLLLQGKCQLVSEHFMIFKKNETN